MLLYGCIRMYPIRYGALNRTRDKKNSHGLARTDCLRLRVFFKSWTVIRIYY